MSRAIASARQRRAGLTAQEPPVSTNVNPPPPANGLTLQQVIALVDGRLVKLETFMKDTQNKPFERSVHFATDTTTTEGSQESNISDIATILEDYNSRFMLLAEEIAQLKDTLMKLQTYTMDVNKMLLEERVNILSDLGEDKTMFVMGDTSLSGNEIDKFEQNTTTEN